jgi:protein-tyrosine kinase
MTEQSKIPVPPGRPATPSLIERAAGAFDLGGFQNPVQVSVQIAVQTAGASPVPVAPARQSPTPPAFARPGFDGNPARQTFRGTFHPIDRRHLREQCLIEPDGPVTGLLEEFRIVKRQLLLTAAESRAGRGAAHGERILVCSAHPGEGKTFCAVNLALSLASERDSEVLLVDADVAKPQVLSTLGLPNSGGLIDAIANPALDVERLIVRTDIPKLSVLPAGKATNDDTELLSSARAAEIIAGLATANERRIVIIDSAPALAASPAAVLAHRVGRILMVVRADRTKESDLQEAIALLDGCNDISLLLNGASFFGTNRTYGSYYGSDQS